jgi:hypothetical protein
VDAVLVVEAGVGRHRMSSCRHHHRWRACQRGWGWRQWWRGARWVGNSTGGAAGGCTVPWWSRRWWSCMRRQRRTRYGRWSRRRRPWERHCCGGAGRSGAAPRARQPCSGGGFAPGSAAAVARRRGWGEGRRRRSSPRLPWRCTRALQCSGPGAAGSLICVLTAVDCSASERSPSAAARPVGHCCCCGSSGGNPGSAVVAVRKQGGRGGAAPHADPGAASGEAARPWRRLRPLERSGGGAEALGWRGVSAAQFPAPARTLHPGAAAGRGIGVPTAADGGDSPELTALPLPPSHHRLDCTSTFIHSKWAGLY